MSGQTDAKIPEDRAAVLGRIPDIVLPRTGISGQEREEFGSKALEGVRREFLQTLVAQDGAEPRSQAPGAEQVGVHLHDQTTLPDQPVREPVARAFAVDDDDVLMERLAVGTGEHGGEPMGQRRHVETLIKVQAGHRGNQ